MTARRDLAESTAAAERDIARLFAALAPAIRRSVERHAENGIITDAGRRAIMRDVDARLPLIYGARRGDDSALQRLILTRANEARAKPVAAEVARIERVLRDEPVLLERMKRG